MLEDSQDLVVEVPAIESEAFGVPTVCPTLRVGSLARGFRQAHARFVNEGRLTREPKEAFFPIFEALTWAVALDDRLALGFSGDRTKKDWGWRRAFADGETMMGVRFVRNRVHHQWADALYLSKGRAYPKRYPVVYFEWKWRGQLPPGRDDQGADEYRRLLVDQPARTTLSALDRLFREALLSLGHEDS
jgi:hypothetical protein